MADFAASVAGKTPGGYVVKGNLMNLLDAVVARVSANPLVSANQIPVISHWSADLWTHLKKVINKSLGLLVVVRLQPSGTGQQKACNAMLRNTRLQVRILENVLFNQSAQGTRVAALALAETLACLSSEDGLQGWKPGPETGLPHEIWLDDDNTIAEVTDKDNEAPGGVVVWALNLTTSVCLIPAVAPEEP